MGKFKILVADDERSICELLRRQLEGEGYRIVTASSGKEALQLAHTESPALITLDVGLPDMDGFEVLRQIREFSQVPVLLLTRRGDLVDRLTGFDLGADDYVVKPFESKEVAARIRAILRRTNGTDEGGEVIYDNLTVNLARYELKVKGVRVDAPPKELELLYFLAKNPNRVFTRDQLLDKVWGFEYFGDSRTVDVHVKRLREKLQGASKQWRLKTVWGVGYKFEVQD